MASDREAGETRGDCGGGNGLRLRETARRGSRQPVSRSRDALHIRRLQRATRRVASGPRDAVSAPPCLAHRAFGFFPEARLWLRALAFPQTSPLALAQLIMAADSTDKSSRKHKKVKAEATPDALQANGEDKPRKSKKAKAQDPTLEVAQEGDSAAVATAIQDTASAKKEKKHKKRKQSEGDPVERDVPEPEEPRKKKKKRVADESASVKVEDADTVVSSGQDAATAKKAKSKKKGKESKGQDESAEVVADAEGDVDHAAQSEERPAKEKRDKKKDKQKRKKGAEDDEGGGGERKKGGDATPSKPHKKRKRHTTSGFPDPSQDEDLTEQAQKALHYAFTQFEEPEAWKFNKARQNWIIRNLWSESAIPERYLALVTRYLQGVQGGAREALIKSCREASGSTPKINGPTPSESKSIAPDTDAQTESPTEKAVTFAVPEPESQDDSTETKRIRASALLGVLTPGVS
ncbi:hypothetical protein BD413DRAFT_547118 [Trametes elegans]|nr:hypothetical protein BD413DRAFT_547118 [Trametes elegans]